MIDCEIAHLLICSFAHLLICSFALLACAVQTYGAFEDGFIGARAYAMGGAFTAIANESDGLLVNPASLSNVSSQQLSATTARLHIGLSDETAISQHLVSYATSKWSQVSLGLVWKRLNVGDLYSENYIIAGVSRDFEFGDTEKRHLSLGISSKFLSWDTSPTLGANGLIVEDLPGRSRVSFGAGVIFRPSPQIPIALSLQNFNTPNVASEGSASQEELLLITVLGIGVLGQKFTWGLDLVFRENQVDVHGGLEQTFNGGDFVLRGGFRLENLAWGTNITLGGGYRPRENLRIDYGFVFPVTGIEDTYGSHRFSVVSNF